jgi:LuxR family maltose regulon positive regulatory protein
VQIKTRRNSAARQQLHFTAAEKRVLVLLPTHLTEEAIGERIGRRRSTVKTHVAHIYKKLGAHSRGEAIARAQEKGLFPGPAVVPGHVSPPEELS